MHFAGRDNARCRAGVERDVEGARKVICCPKGNDPERQTGLEKPPRRCVHRAVATADDDTPHLVAGLANLG